MKFARIRAALHHGLLLPLLIGVLHSAHAQLNNDDDPLPPEEAFRFSAETIDANTLRATWTVAEGHYVYDSKLRFESATPGVALGTPKIPEGKIKNDEFFGEQEVHRGTIQIEVPVFNRANSDSLKLIAHSQGCADRGICYPPYRIETKLPLILASSDKPTAADLLGGIRGADKSAVKGGIKGLVGLDSDEPLPPEEAFRFYPGELNQGVIPLRWDIADGHYLYRDKFSFTLVESDGLQLGTPAIPAGKKKEDPLFGEIEAHYKAVAFDLPLVGNGSATIEVTWQGCAERGICYPPQKQIVNVTGAGLSADQAAARVPAIAGSNALGASEQDRIADSLANDGMALALLTFFGFGLLLAFTPCVFPMIPILSGIIIGQGEQLTAKRGLYLSAIYVLAMALTYSVAGVLAGLFGQNLQAAFQNPWVLTTFAAVFVALAFSMFGFYELQLPSSLQSKVTMLSNKQKGGTTSGVAIMGLLSAVIVGPCVAPPLAGALIYIGQTGDAVLGGLALFAMALGMGAPLLLIGASAGRILPRAGAWMDAVKAVFGVLMLAVAIWLLERVLPATVILLLWSALLIISAIYMGALERIADGASGWRKLWKGLGILLLGWGLLMLIGASAGKSDPLAPLAGFGIGGGSSEETHLEFRTIKGIEGLETALAQAKAANQTVMLDFYADWCIACKELEKYTFTDKGVQDALAGTLLIQADVTANDKADQALLKSLGLIGPPAILFYDRNGNEVKNARLVGFVPPEDFTPHARAALQ
jgi:thiol:disulfide interchange protein DsbD